MVLLAAMCQVIIQCGALPNLLNLCSHTKKAIRKETLWTISNITAGNKDQIEEVPWCQIVPALLTSLAAWVDNLLPMELKFQTRARV